MDPDPRATARPPTTMTTPASMHRPRRLGLAAAAALLFSLLAASPAQAQNRNRRPPAPSTDSYVESHVDHDHGNERRGPRWARQLFDRGASAGSADGRAAGFRDGKRLRPFRARPVQRLDGFPRAFRRGYRQAFEDAYRAGYVKGKRSRRRGLGRRCWQHRW